MSTNSDSVTTERRFTRFQCWRDERIGTVINTEAISVDRANFLATHAPVTGIAYERGRQNIGRTSEEGLLRELLRLEDHSEHGFIVLQGIPGSGKSHLIRWLKERYDAENRERGGRDVVLLIERATSSLRGTLRQVIESAELRASGVFDDQGIAEQLERIRSAANVLSGEGLADSLLNGLQVAMTEVAFPGEETLNRRIQRGAGPFLLDLTARAWLKRPDGAIDRLTRFLTAGRDRGVAPGESPGFESHDFDFDMEVLEGIRNKAYQDVINLVEGLVLRESLRQEFAQCLNRRLNFAIGRTTQLSADDLKGIFNDLRRALHQRGLRLTLFIEDITAFTGIDAGLVDVLATQHTGEGNRQFCRIISVVGVTPDYYHQRFPDNLKERVTHRLRLTGDTANDPSDHPSVTRQAITDLAARYLNAIRLPQDQIELWLDAGARPEQLPNACAECPFRPTCHASFGDVAIGGQDDERLRLGLYPFNTTALQSMFERLDPGKTTRTPRSLLNSILRHVLTFHGSGVSRGEFPPRPANMGSDFNAPTLDKPAQERLIATQAGPDAERVESLVVFWGNRTIDSTIQEETRLVGGLPREVFEAFDVPFIEGENLTTSRTLKTPRGDGTTSEDVQRGPVKQSPNDNLYRVDINAWQAGGRLTRYEKLRDWLVSYAKGAIDWEAHNVAQELVNDRMTSRRFEIEGQSGRVTGEPLVFLRSDPLAYALQAVADLAVQMETLDSPALAGHLMTLRLWLDDVEADIVEFVRRPSRDQSEPIPYLQLLIMNGLMLECLAGDLSPERSTVRDLYVDLVKGSAAAVQSRDRAIQNWNSQILQLRDYRSTSWTQLMSRVGGDRAQASRSLLLAALNCSQGGAPGVKFVDADAALEAISAFRAKNWQPQVAVNLSGNLPRPWAKPWETFLMFAEHFNGTMSTEQEHLKSLRESLQIHLDGEKPSTAFTAIDGLLSDMAQYGLPSGGFERNPDAFTARGLHYQLRRLDLACNESHPINRILRLSSVLTVEQQVRNYLTFFEAFVKMVDRRAEWARDMRERLGKEQPTQLRDEVLRLYAEMDQLGAYDARNEELIG